MDLIEEFESTYLALLEGQAEKVRERHPSFIINVGAHRRGGNFKSEWLLVAVSCGRRPELDSAEQPNLVELTIEVHNLLNTPVLADLGVGWGGDGTPPPVESLWMLNGEIPFNRKSMTIIDDALPTLFGHLERCLIAWEMTYPANV